MLQSGTINVSLLRENSDKCKKCVALVSCSLKIFVVLGLHETILIDSPIIPWIETLDCCKISLKELK